MTAETYFITLPVRGMTCGRNLNKTHYKTAGMDDAEARRWYYRMMADQHIDPSVGRLWHVDADGNCVEISLEGERDPRGEFPPYINYIYMYTILVLRGERKEPRRKRRQGK